MDDALFVRLSGQDLDALTGKIVVALTVDEAGWPHPALLSYSEVVAKDRQNIRLAAYRDSTLTRVARRSGPATLAVFDEGLAQYIKGVLSESRSTLDGAPGSAKLNLRIHAVLSDDPDPRDDAGSRIVGGITFLDGRTGRAGEGGRRLIAELLDA